MRYFKILLLFYFISAAAEARVYKCIDQNGKTFYQQSVCDDDDRQRRMSFKNIESKATLEDVYNHQENVENELAILKGMNNGYAVIGMTKKQLTTAIGEPDNIDVVRMDGLTKERWMYGDVFDYTYIYLKNGSVYAIQYKN